ncbi:MAG: fibronectin type III domain-containing protein [Phycisphaerales bacterium]|nr:fibronectin type III domain-containing protein [Phycisphaerales bacterium]
MKHPAPVAAPLLSPLAAALAAGLLLGLAAPPAHADGWTWDFNSTLAARAGAAQPLTGFGTYSFETATIGGQSAGVAHFFAGSGPDTDARFTVTNPAGANGGSSLYTNQYTLLFDVRFPASDWVSLYQSNVSNANDGECFIRSDGGIGVSGDYDDGGNPLRYDYGQWRRIAIVIDDASTSGNATFRCFVDGELQNQVQAPTGWGTDARFSLDAIFYLFADESGDTPNEGWVNSFQFRDYAMKDADVAALGGASASGIPDAPKDGGGGFYINPFIQSVTTSSAWIVWESASGDESRVDFGPTPALGSTASGSAQTSEGARRIHQTQLAGLAPDTIYYYAATTGGVTSDIGHFRTAPLASAEKPFRFAAVSDTQHDLGNPTKLGEIVNDGIIAYLGDKFGGDLADDLAFWIDAGDIVDNGTVTSQWKDDLFDAVQNLAGTVPLYPVPGNHDQDAHWFFDYFVLPTNGTPGYTEHWWYNDYGNVRIIGLDSNTGYTVQAQLDWLDGVLADAATDSDIDFVFAQIHHPFKSELWTPGEIPYTGEVVRRLEAFSAQSGKPSIHFFGHTHAYSRGQSKDFRHLWVNVASGEGNIDYWGEYPNADYPEFQYSLPDYGFALVEVQAGETPSFRLDRVSRGNEYFFRDNEVVDSITVRLHDGAPAAPTPEHPIASDPPADPDGLMLQASAYSDPEDDAHWESEFQVTTLPGDYSNPVADQWIRFENWYAPPGADGGANGAFSINTVTDPDVTHVSLGSLEPNSTYYWRVRYRDAGLTWSDWSAEASFATGGSSLGPNLLVNPGAEQGVSGWTILDPPLESLAAGDCASETNPVEGARFFAVGGVCADEGPYGEAMQPVDVTSHATAIDGGLVDARIAGALKDYSGSDRPDIWLVYKNAGGATLGQSAKVGSNTSSWQVLSAVDPVPLGTRTIEFHLSGTRNGGTDNDSYADALELRLRIANPCTADFNGDGDVNTQDVLAFLNAWVGHENSADINGDGSVNTQDVIAYLNLWAAGC